MIRARLLMIALDLVLWLLFRKARVAALHAELVFVATDGLEVRMWKSFAA